MALRACDRLSSTKNLLQQCVKSKIVVPSASFWGRSRIGTREVVGYGSNGQYIYFDRMDVPCPAIRFREDNDEIKRVKSKEKSDWKNLTVEEKKLLYRSNYCRTFSEMQAPTGSWKQISAGILLCLSVGMTMFVLMKDYLLPPLPYSFSEEMKAERLKWLLALKQEPVEGLASKWDYEKNDWKK